MTGCSVPGEVIPGDWSSEIRVRMPRGKDRVNARTNIEEAEMEIIARDCQEVEIKVYIAGMAADEREALGH